MSFFKSIKRVFGFGDDVDTEAYDQEPLAIPAPDQVEVPASTGKLEIDSEHADLIFQHVVSIFNQALPSFIADSVDSEKQRKLLYDSLDQSLKEYLKSLQIKATQQCQEDWMAERDKLQANADELKKHAEELEEKRARLKDKQLSAERQKRALSERVRDLEAQVLRLESEKEQLDIENKCMQNKAKATAVLEAELEELRANSNQNDAIRNEVNDAMLSDFKRQAAEATQKLKEKEERLASIDEALNLKDAQIDDLKQELALKEEALNNSISAEELEVIQSQISQFEEVRQKMDTHIEKLREALRKAQEENRILNEALKKSLKENSKEESPKAVQAKAESPKAEQPKAESPKPQSPEKYEFSDIVAEPSATYKPTPKAATIPQPEPQPEPQQTAFEEPAPKKDAKPREESRQKSKRGYIGDLDDVDAIISGSNWMVSMPEEESPMGSKNEKAAFGYQAPQRKRVSDHDPQPSLFDF